METRIAVFIGALALNACESGNHSSLVSATEVAAPDASVDPCARLQCGPLATCAEGVCVCPAGYAHGIEGCADVDECAAGLDDCHARAQCTNIEAGFRCACPPGYAGDGRTCADLDECAQATAACDPNATCANTDGGYDCACAPGFEGDGTRCVDVDECAGGAHECAGHGICTNTVGSYGCRCAEGYQGDGRQCVDVDECALATDNCSDFARCSNISGGFLCACAPGFVGDGVRCDDVDECADALPVCPENAACVNGVGSFQCPCDGGFVSVGGFCEDLDECAAGMDQCDADATCVNTPGGYRCACPEGLMAIGLACVDEDECAEGTDDCHAAARCINTRGGFQCACGPGYTGDGRDCADVDECAQSTDDCHADAVCLNDDGGFRCVCAQGYEGDGRQCADVDECARDIAFCHRDAACNNRPGDWECVCGAGFEGDGVISCDDVDECATGRDRCAAEAACTNRIGSYECDCAEGYRGDGYTCDDIDECLEGAHGCRAEPLCVNTAGGFECAPTVLFACDCGAGGDPRCVAGDDDAQGLIPQAPWRTLDRLSDPAFLAGLEPGVSIRLCRGGVFDADLQLAVGLRCTPAGPCAIGAYDPPGQAEGGADPLILGQLRVPDTLRGVVVDGLAFAGMGMGEGVSVDAGATDITLRHLTVTGWAVGVAAPSAVNLTLSDSSITDNRRAGWLGGGQGILLQRNTFARNAGIDFTHHNVHLACADGCEDVVVRGNEVTESSMGDDGVCFMPAIGVFGRASGVIIEGNHIHEALLAAGRGCDGIAVGPETRGREEGFTDVAIRGNRVINMGGTAIGVSACQACVVENNVVVQEQALVFKGIVGPDRRVQAEDAELDAFVVRNNSIWIGDQIDTVAIAIQVYRQGGDHQIVNNAIGNLSLGFNSCCLDQDRDLGRYADVDHNICLLNDANPRASWALGYPTLERWRATGFGANSQEVDPGYAAPTGPTFDLSPADAESSVVNAGKTGASPGTDLAGRARDELPDVGAYEYAPAP